MVIALGLGIHHLQSCFFMTITDVDVVTCDVRCLHIGVGHFGSDKVLHECSLLLSLMLSVIYYYNSLLVL